MRKYKIEQFKDLISQANEGDTLEFDFYDKETPEFKKIHCVEEILSININETLHQGSVKTQDCYLTEKNMNCFTNIVLVKWEPNLEHLQELGFVIPNNSSLKGRYLSKVGNDNINILYDKESNLFSLIPSSTKGNKLNIQTEREMESLIKILQTPQGINL